MDWEIHPLRPRDFPWSWVLHPSTLGISLGLRPREIPRVSGCKTHDRGKSLEISLDPRDFPRASPSGNLSGLGKSWASGMDFPIHPSSWWSTDTITTPVPLHEIMVHKNYFEGMYQSLAFEGFSIFLDMLFGSGKRSNFERI